MIHRRLLFALPALLAMPARADPADGLARVLAACWQARGVAFSPESIAARIGARTGKAALLAVAGATASDDGEEWETAVEIVWEAGQPPSPAAYLLQRDLAKGLPLLLLHRNGQPMLLHRLAGDMAQVSDPMTGAAAALAMGDVMLIGRPVIAGA